MSGLCVINCLLWARSFYCVEVVQGLRCGSFHRQFHKSQFFKLLFSAKPACQTGSEVLQSIVMPCGITGNLLPS